MRQSRTRHFGCVAAFGVGLALASVGPVLAHAGDAGFVLLLPTGYYLAGGALAVALVVFLALHARAESGVLRLPTAAPRRERFVVLCALTSTALLQVASFAVNRSDISPADSPRYLYFVVGLLLPAVGVALTAAIGRVGQLTVAALLVYLVVTQGLVLVAAERPLEQSSMRGDVRGIAHLIVRGEPVAPVALAQDVDVAAITKWYRETVGSFRTRWFPAALPHASTPSASSANAPRSGPSRTRNRNRR